jgi:hypothetical protein
VADEQRSAGGVDPDHDHPELSYRQAYQHAIRDWFADVTSWYYQTVQDVAEGTEPARTPPSSPGDHYRKLAQATGRIGTSSFVDEIDLPLPSSIHRKS